MIYLSSQRLVEKMSQALKNEDSCIYTTELVFHNPNSGFKFKARYISQMSVIQDFVSSYTDTIQVQTELTPEEFTSLLSNMQDLECSITLFPTDDKVPEIKMEQDPIFIDGKVFLDNQEDLEKKFPEKKFGDPETGEKQTESEASIQFPFKFHVVEPDVYEIRHVQLNAVFNEVTMESLLHWACERFNVEQVKITKPDNDKAYNNLVIPPMHDISTLFPFLQERYGIYAKGLGYYYSEKTLSIYPIADQDTETSPEQGILHIVKAPEKYFLGLEVYHTPKEEDIYICIISKAELQPLNTQGAENIGNVQMSTDADKMRDKYVTVQPDGKVMRNQNDISVVTLQNSAGNMSSSMQNIKFTGESSNKYVATSEMASIDGTILKVNWLRAVPRLVRPGQSVVYHYDGAQGVYKTQKGRLQRAVYVGELKESKSQYPWLVFTAALEIGLDADKKSDEEVQSLDT